MEGHRPRRARRHLRRLELEEGETFYDAMKKEMGGRLARTRAALDALDGEQRLVMEGHRPGVYLRLSFTGAACRCSV